MAAPKPDKPETKPTPTKKPEMRKRGLLIMSFGFIEIMWSPASSGATDIRVGILTTGLFLVGLGLYFFLKDRKAFDKKHKNDKED